MNSLVGSTFLEWNWTTGIVFVAVLCLIKWYHRPGKFPPGPRGIPGLGYLPFLGKYPEKTAFQLSKKYGPLLSIRMGLEDIIFVNDHDTIVKTFVRNGEVFSGRPRMVVLEPLKDGHGIVFRDYSNEYLMQRKFGLMTLRGFGVGKKGMEKICLEESSFLQKEIEKRNGKAFDISTLLHTAVSNNICHVVFGNRHDYDDKEFHSKISLLVNLNTNAAVGFMNRMIVFAPILKKLPLFAYFNRKILDSLQNVFDWVESIVKEHESTFDKNNLRDFMDAFILEKNKGENDSFSNVQMLHFIHELFLAGTTTTSSTLGWGLLCLVHYPETQMKLRKEILSVLGESGTVTMSNKADMPYTNAFIQELFRFRTLAPLALMHKTTQDSEFDGFLIPKGTKIQPNIWAVHNDPKLWKKPEIFNPERFLDEEGNFISSNHVIPFSVGPRHCLGEQLARMEVFIFLVGMVQKFEFLPDPSADCLPDITGVRGLAHNPRPYKIVAKEV